MKWIQIDGSIAVPDDTDFDNFSVAFESVMCACGWQFFGIFQPQEKEGENDV